jgi:hypothetical protein
VSADIIISLDTHVTVLLANKEQDYYHTGFDLTKDLGRNAYPVLRLSPKSPKYGPHISYFPNSMGAPEHPHALYN